MSAWPEIGGQPGHSTLRVGVKAAAAVALLTLYQAWPQPLLLLDLAIQPAVADGIGRAVGTCFWVSLAIAVDGALSALVWRGILVRESGAPAPKLLTQLVSFALWVATLVIVLAFVFEVPVSGFLTTSGIIIAVIGFALRNLIADVFTGIALGIERPFNVGDWIEFDGERPGRVVEINWRTTRLISREEIAVVVPNSQLATHAFRNYHAPEKFWRDAIEIVLPYDVTAHQAERILLSAVAQVPESIDIPREPEVRISEYTNRGAKWQLRFWVPDYTTHALVRYRVQRNVLRNLHYAGVEVPRMMIDMLDASRGAAGRDPEEDRIRFLHDIAPLAPLTREELQELGSKMRRRLCLEGVAVVRQGDEGSSLFVIKEGALEVSIKSDAGIETIVGQLNPGMFFGEMSLLTGAPRSATVVPSVDSVVFEITKSDLEPMLLRRQEMAVQLSEVLADRQMRNVRLMSERKDSDPAMTKVSLARQFLAGIQAFFGLGHHPSSDIRSIRH